jgi:hypothetical protein
VVLLLQRLYAVGGQELPMLQDKAPDEAGEKGLVRFFLANRL